MLVLLSQLSERPHLGRRDWGSLLVGGLVGFDFGGYEDAVLLLNASFSRSCPKFYVSVATRAGPRSLPVSCIRWLTTGFLFLCSCCETFVLVTGFCFFSLVHPSWFPCDSRVKPYFPSAGARGAGAASEDHKGPPALPSLLRLLPVGRRPRGMYARKPPTDRATP